MKKIFLFLILVFKFAAASELNRPLRNNLYDDYSHLLRNGAQAKHIHDLNLKALEEIYSQKFDVSPGRIGSVTYEQAETILSLVQTHPVTGDQGKMKYDPDGTIGFCFGRALFVHLELLRRGVQKQAIKKVFAVGPMQVENINWQFHVATVVKGPGSKWLVIDTAMGQVITVEEWFNFLSRTNKDGLLRFYISEPAKIGPSAWEYNIKPGGLHHQAYRNYFKDMFEYFKKNPIRKDQKFNY